MTPSLWPLATYAAIAAGSAFGLVLALIVWRSCRNSTAKWSDLIVDHDTGRASHTKLWVHIANAATIILFVRIGWNAVAGEGVAWLFFVVLGLIGGSQVASRIMTSKYGGTTAAPGTTTTETKLEEKKTTVAAAPAAVPAANPPNDVNPSQRSQP